MIQTLSAFLLVITGAFAHAHGGAQLSEEWHGKQPIMTDVHILRTLGIPYAQVDEEMGVAIADVSSQDAARVSELGHEMGRCGSFTALPESQTLSLQDRPELAELRQAWDKNKSLPMSLFAAPMTYDAQIQSAIDEVSAENLKAWVTWLSSFETRYCSANTRNVHVEQLKTRIEEMLAGSSLKYTVSFVEHTRTKQNSLKVTIPGTRAPNEIVVVGAHLDSISGWGSGRAPGADDNASGSANLLEALRILANEPQPQRTIEFYWYAAEEIGLVGSNEIATAAKNAGRDVISVMQLDMTLHPGNGFKRIGNVTDYTHPWLQEYHRQLVSTYLPDVTVIDFRCGYGCSDHASWYNKGYASFAPFEADMDSMNNLIHTAKDVINSNSNFEHSAVFSKIALIYLMDMGNSSKRVP